MSGSNLRESQSFAGSRNSGKSDGQRRATRAWMTEMRVPSLSDDLQQYLYPPPNPEYTNGVSELYVFLPSLLNEGKGYFDEYGTAVKRSKGLQGDVYSGMAFHTIEHTAVLLKKWKNGDDRKQFVDIVCSAGPTLPPKKCIPCRRISEGADLKTGDKWAFEVFHAAWYHEQPLIGKDGQIVKKRDSSEPIIIRKECLTLKPLNELFRRKEERTNPQFRKYKACEGCQNAHPMVFGAIRIIKVGKGHYDNICDLQDVADARCKICRTAVATVSYHCPNPACRMQWLDTSTAQMTELEIKNFRSTPTRCAFQQPGGQVVGCGQEGFPISRRICGYSDDFRARIGGCNQYTDHVGSTATSLEISDMVYRLQREGEGTNSHIEAVGAPELLASFVVPALPWAPPGGCKDNQGTPLPQLIAQVRKEPLKLNELYAPLPLEDQSAALEIQHQA